MFVKSTHFKQVCQLLLSLIVAIVHPHLHKPRTSEKQQIQMMLTILMNKSNTFDQQHIIIKSSGIPSGSTVVPSICCKALSVDGKILHFVSEELW